MKKEIKNAGHSIKMRLWNIAAENKRDKNDNQIYQLIAIRYIQEGILYRLSRSKYCDKFFLKGGALLYAYDRFDARPTVDIDFLGSNISRDIENIKSVFNEILSCEFPEDGVIFIPESLTASEITVNKEYHGVRLMVSAKIDTMIQPVTMDIGFGDVVTPAPQTLEYPILMEGFPVPVILAYSLETVIAEKFEAMISLSVDNSRMKDFFDVYRLLKFHSLNEENLSKAIENTFQNRQTQLVKSPALFQQDFITDKHRLTQWKAFLKRIKWKEEMDFGEICSFIKDKLGKYYYAFSSREN